MSKRLKIMKRGIHKLSSSAVLAILTSAALVFGASLAAQDPFGDPAAPPPAQKQAPGAAEEAATKQAAGKDANGAKKPEPPVDPSRYSLPIRAVLEGNPQTPAQLVRAASVLIDLGEPELAKRFVLRLHESARDDDTLAELVARLGSGPFLKIAGEKQLEPEGREIADRAIAAANKKSRDPAQLAQLIEQLGSPSAEARRRAIAGLLNAHEDAAPPLLLALNDPGKKAIHRLIREALVALDEDAVGPLLAALDGPDGPAKIAAIETLGRVRASQATPRLVGLYALPETNEPIRQAAENALIDLHGKTPNSREAVRYLEQLTRRLLSAEERIPTNAEGNVEIWAWDAVKGQPVPITISLQQARSEMAARHARDLFELSRANAEHRRLYVVSMLEAEAYRVGLDNPVPRDKGSAFADAREMGAEAVEDALSYAIERGHAAAAMLAASVLGEIGDAGMLVRGGDASPLAKALTHNDRRLRFAAAQAIVNLRPTRPFAGLSDLQRTLVYFATSVGERRALVGFPNADTAQKLAGMINSLGFEADTATNGRELLLGATKTGDYELIVISNLIDRGPLYLVLQDLRKHTHTAQTPVIVLADEVETDALYATTREDPLTTVALRPRDVEGMKYAVEQSIRRAGDRIMSPLVREKQAQEAIRSIAELGAAAPKVFDFRADEKRLALLLNVPSMSASAASVLAQFGTHTSQQSLLEIANRTSQPLASRQAAALAFGDSVRRFGVRLTKDEILRQYDRYNQSEVEDKASQGLLSAVLDAIELPSKAGRVSAPTGND